jgi:hypothetical protein
MGAWRDRAAVPPIAPTAPMTKARRRLRRDLAVPMALVMLSNASGFMAILFCGRRSAGGVLYDKAA